MAEIDLKLNQFFSDLYGPLAKTERVQMVRQLVKKFILSVMAPEPENEGPETASTGR